MQNYFLSFLFLFVLCKGHHDQHAVLDRDVVEAIRESLEPLLSELFHDILRDSKGRVEDWKKFHFLAKVTQSPLAKSLLTTLIMHAEGEGQEQEKDGSIFIDKYRSMLILAQRSYFGLVSIPSFSDQFRRWHLIDGLIGNLHFSRKLQNPKPLELMEQHVGKLALELEARMARYSDPYYFFESMKSFTAGILTPYPQLEDDGRRAYLSQEMALLLDPHMRPHLVKLTALGCNRDDLEGLMDRIQSPIRASAFKQALRHWRHYTLFNVSLATSHPDLSLVSLAPKETLNSIETFLEYRMRLLRESMPQIFTWDHRATSGQLLTGWSLAQYLKYISRLVQNQQLRTKLEDLVLDFGHRSSLLMAEISGGSGARYDLNIPNKQCRVGNTLLKNLFLVSAPLPFGGFPIYHYAVVTFQEDGTMSLLRVEDKESADLLLVVSEPAFNDSELLNTIFSKVLDNFCH